MSIVLITGGTGLIGTAVTKALLGKNYEVIILSRFQEKYSSREPGLTYAKWDIKNQTIDNSAVARADYIIHLAGAGIADKRWTAKRKNEIIESRVQGSHLLIKSLQDHVNNVKVVISASGIGWYGSSELREPGMKEHPFVETDPPSDDFLGTACREWEASIDPVTTLGKRLVKFRTAIALSNEGGALKEFKKFVRFGIAPILGYGKQVMSWIHIDDLVRLYIYALENEKLEGVYNAVAPQTVTNKKFVLQLARTTRGKFYVPVFVPSFILEIVRGEVSVEVLKSAPVSADKIQREGYQFLYPSLQSALRQLAESGETL